MAIHVNALSSALKRGDILGANFEWDFGDSGSKYNTLVGFNAAHAYTEPGTYTITLKVTNSAGGWDTATMKVTVTAANRPFVYVSPDGDDSNNGSSQTNAVKTFKRASQLVGDNTEVLFERGNTYSVADSMNLGHSNVVVGAYGSGADPVIKYTGGMDYGTIFATLGGKDVLVHDITFDSSSTTTGDQGYNDGVRAGGQNITVRDSTFVNVGYAINTNGSPEGVLVQDNVAPNKNSVRAYFSWVQGKDHVYLGNSVKDSLHAHVIRIGGAERVNIAYNDFSNPTGDPTGKDQTIRGTLAIHKAAYVYIRGNKLTDGAVGIGPLGDGDGISHPQDRTQWTVFEDNEVHSPLWVEHGTEHVVVRNNVIYKDGGAAIDVDGYNATYKRTVLDATFTHNTAVNDGTDGNFMKVGNGAQEVVLAANLYVAPNLQTGASGGAVVYVADSDLSEFTSISGDIWDVPKTLDYAQGGYFYVWPSWADSKGYKTPAEWDAFAQVHGDVYANVKLSAGKFNATVQGVTAGASL